MFQHTKGVLKALVIAIVAIFGLSLIIPQQIALQHDIVVNLSQDSVFKFLENGENMKSYFPNLKGLKIEYKGDGDFVFIGHDGDLHRLELRTANKAKGVELTYYSDDDKKGVFLLTTKKYNNQTLLMQTQFWNLGYNPLAKLLGHQTKKESQEKLEDEMIILKSILEQ
jgi:hypothetical protein